MLQDEAKRKRYDASGSLPGDDGLGDEDMGEDFDWVQYFSAIFQKVDASSIGKFESSYKGGEEEATDVIKYYLACGGDGKKMLSCVMCSLPSDVPRWKRDVLGPAIERGDIDDLGFKNFDLAGMEEEDEGEGMDLEDESPASLPQGHKEKETEENESTASNAASSPPKKKAASKSKARAKKSARSAASTCLSRCSSWGRAARRHRRPPRSLTSRTRRATATPSAKRAAWRSSWRC